MQRFDVFVGHKVVNGLHVAFSDGLADHHGRFCFSFGQAFETQFLHQDGPRTLEQSMALGWRVLASLPPQELTRLSDAQIAEHLSTAPA